MKDVRLVKDILKRIKKRDFRGNSGILIKNSTFNLAAVIVSRIGSLIFTAVLARMLMPELFGLYSLALSTILIFGTFSELGIEVTLIRFISKEFDKNKRKLKAYLAYLAKIKAYSLIGIAIVMLLFANYLATHFYQKPVFLALLAGILYIAFNQMSGFLKSMVQASNSFSSIPKREAAFNIIRLILVPIAVLISLKYSLSNEIHLMIIILALSFSLFLASLFYLLDLKKFYFDIFKKGTSRLSIKEKKKINTFLLAAVAFSLSGVFFGNIDKVMLGGFIPSEFIGYYSAAFTLMGSFIALTTSFSAALLPLFSRLSKRKLEKSLNAIVRLVLLASTLLFLIIVPSSYYIILLIYGKEYLLSVNLLRALSLLLFLIPLISIYQTYYLSKGRPGVIAKLLIISSTINVLLNYFLIKYFVQYGGMAAVYGAVIATITSKICYLGGLLLLRR